MTPYRLFNRTKSLTAGMLLCGVVACGSEEVTRGGRPTAPQPIIPFEVEMREEARIVQAVGTARARLATVVRPETAGFVEDVLFAPGAFVEQGTPLLRLEADDERLSVRLARVAVQEAEQLLARYRRIENTGAVSASAIDEAMTQLEAAKINLEQAELRLTERTVRAPFAGYVGLSDIDPGARITQDTSITALDDRRVLFIDFSVPEDVFSVLRAGSEVTAIPFTEDALPLEAEVILVDSRVDPESRAFRARAALDNAEDSLRPGMSFEVRFAVTGRDYPSVPETSIVWGTNGAYVWVIEGGRATEKSVSVISRQDGKVLVDGDLARGDLVIAEGVQKVREGALVTYEGAPVAAAPGIETLR
ncbi:MAG: efflux RND transporter periplasmic adaptor subunit [Pseudomonadota bacterium]